MHACIHAHKHAPIVYKPTYARMQYILCMHVSRYICLHVSSFPFSCTALIYLFIHDCIHAYTSQCKARALACEARGHKSCTLPTLFISCLTLGRGGRKLDKAGYGGPEQPSCRVYPTLH